ncbi:MAG TPA: DegV family protein [Actinotalea sp.]|nr:DegV family protein [Actinotalea sp.]
MSTTGHVAVVTDSTASLPAALVEASGVVVVPLHVVVDGVDHREGIDLTTGQLVAALRAGSAVSTAQPGPDAFARVYARMVARGAQEIVSVHLSAELSGTVAAARLAAASAGVPVHVVDSRTVGMALGLGVLAAAQRARRARSGAEAAAAAQVAVERSGSASVHFAVDTLEHLRRGGRLGPVAAALGTVLGLRPVLTVRGGRLDVVEKVRTSARARERLVELAAADAARRGAYDLAVHHLAEPDLAARLVERLRAACPPGLRDVHVAELSAVVGAHVGPGLAAVVVADA